MMNRSIIILLTWCASALGARNLTNRYVMRLSTNFNITDVAKRHPYIVCLLDKGTIRECTGTLINAEWVITAAHCIVHNDITFIQYGNMSIPPKNTAFKSPVLERVPHPKYKFGEQITYDIGLLRVQEVPLKVFGTLSPLTFEKLLGRNVEYAGFGIRMTQKMLRRNYRIETLVLVQTRPLHLSEGIVTSCDDIILIEDPRSFLCVIPICRRNVTKLKVSQCVNIHHFAEDSGGPLFCDMKLIGVTSWGGADLAVPAGVFTAIEPYKSWILHTTRSRKPTTPKTTLAKRFQKSMQGFWQRLANRIKWW